MPKTLSEVTMIAFKVKIVRKQYHKLLMLEIMDWWCQTSLSISSDGSNYFL